MGFSVTARNQALNGITVDRVSLHSGDPGTTGANYLSAAGKQVATFAAADAGARALSADVSFSGLSANQSVTHFGVWLNAGDVFQCGAAITTGDVTANASGAYTLKGTNTTITAA